MRKTVRHGPANPRWVQLIDALYAMAFSTEGLRGVERMLCELTGAACVRIATVDAQDVYPPTVVSLAQSRWEYRRIVWSNEFRRVSLTVCWEGGSRREVMAASRKLDAVSLHLQVIVETADVLERTQGFRACLEAALYGSEGTTLLYDDLGELISDEAAPAVEPEPGGMAGERRFAESALKPLHGEYGTWLIRCPRWQRRMGIYPRRLPPVSLIADRLGLTMREAIIARAIANGQTPQEMSGQMAITLHTVRSHLKHIFNKTGLTSQYALAQAVFSLGPSPQNGG